MGILIIKRQIRYKMTRSGKRKGAGRKPAPNKKQKYATMLRPDQVEWLKSQKNAAKEIEDGIDFRIMVKKQYSIIENE